MKKILQVLAGQAINPPPAWVMRQAGRYLPEYRATRARAGNFLNLCYTPKLACEVTLQPIHRFAFDAAIIFSDILVIPAALGQEVSFTDGEGPKLAQYPTAKNLKPFSTNGIIENVYEAISLVKHQLSQDTALIGFAGAAWTLACYMLDPERHSDEFALVRLFAYQQPQEFSALLDILTEAIIAHACAQIKAGAEIIQIFDSWAGVCPADLTEKAIYQPTAKIVAAIKKQYPHIPVIGFARSIGARLKPFYEATGVSALGVDYTQPLALAHQACPHAVLQGNLDPQLLIAGGEPLAQAVQQLKKSMQGKPWIANLGHGITPPTPPEHVAQFLSLLRNDA